MDETLVVVVGATVDVVGAILGVVDAELDGVDGRGVVVVVV